MMSSLFSPRAAGLGSLFALMAISVVGCGHGEKIVAVSGTVTHKGQPVSGLVVSFVPDAQTETGVSTGETDENGKYSLTIVKTQRGGAVAGTHKVWVSLPRQPLGGDKDTGDDSEKEGRAKSRRTKTKNTAKPTIDMAAIIKQYGRLDSTPLTIVVGDGNPIDLKLD